MFFDVTTMVAAVAVVLAITAETTAAMSAFLMDVQPLSRLASPPEAGRKMPP
jgi:hypothetical protein